MSRLVLGGVGAPESREILALIAKLREPQLTVLQRSDMIARFMELSQLATLRPAALALDISKDEVSRSLKIAALSSEAKLVASSLGLDSNQKRLLAATKLPLDDQATYLSTHQNRCAKKQVTFTPDDKQAIALVEMISVVLKKNLPSDARHDALNLLDQLRNYVKRQAVPSEEPMDVSKKPYVDPRSDKTKVFREPVGPKHMRLRRDIKIRDLFVPISSSR